MIVHKIGDTTYRIVGDEVEVDFDQAEINDCFGYKVDKARLRESIIRKVNNERYDYLYTDHDPDEPNTMYYLRLVGTELVDVTDLGKLIAAVNSNDNVYVIIEECYC